MSAAAPQSSEFPAFELEGEAFDDLWDALRERNATAYQQLVADCTPYLLNVIRKRLDRRLRKRFDSIDITQAVWTSFVAQVDQLPPFQNVDELRAYLVQMANFKVVDEVRRQLKLQKRNISREQPFPSSDIAPPTPRATPSQFAVANESLQQIKAGRSPLHQQIIQLKSQGEAVPEIAAAVGLSARQVRRILSALEVEFSEANSNPSSEDLDRSE